MTDSPVAAALALGGCIAAIVAFQFVVAGRAVSPDSQPAVATRKDLHVQRKAQHAVTGLCIYAATSVFSPRTASAVLFSCALAFYAVYRLRKTNDRVDALYLKSFGSILRADEAAKTVVPAAFYFLLGTALVLVLYSPPVARLAILHVSVGDPAASFFGILYGRHALPLAANKSIEGFVGCWAVAAAATFVAISLEADYYKPIVVVTGGTFPLLAGWCAAAAESLNVGVDDNLSLPLLSGLMLQVVAAWE